MEIQRGKAATVKTQAECNVLSAEDPCETPNSRP